jgi:hypothetical protein
MRLARKVRAAIGLPLILGLVITFAGITPSQATDGQWVYSPLGCQVRINRIHLANTRPGVKVSGDGMCTSPSVTKLELVTFLYFCGNTEPQNSYSWLQTHCTDKGSYGKTWRPPTPGKTYTVSAPAATQPDAHGNGWWGAYSGIAVWVDQASDLRQAYATHRQING